MSDKPSYLGLLNAIAVAEGQACRYLTEWAGRTTSGDVRRVLLTVAAREGEHASSFARRINELGYEVRDRPSDGDKALDIVRSDRSDLEKMRALKLHRLDSSDKPDIFDDIFRDHSIDIATGALLGRYISEERDTGRLLRRCYEQLKLAATPAKSSGNGNGVARLEDKVDALCRAVDDLRQIVCAQTMPAQP